MDLEAEDSGSDEENMLESVDESELDGRCLAVVVVVVVL